MEKSKKQTLQETSDLILDNEQVKAISLLEGKQHLVESEGKIDDIFGRLNAHITTIHDEDPRNIIATKVREIDEHYMQKLGIGLALDHEDWRDCFIGVILNAINANAQIYIFEEDLTVFKTGNTSSILIFYKTNKLEPMFHCIFFYKKSNEMKNNSETVENDPKKRKLNMETDEQFLNERTVEKRSNEFRMDREYELLLRELFNIEMDKNQAFVKSIVKPKEGICLYLNGIYQNKKVFIKMTCYITYNENIQVMNIVKNIKSKYINEIIDFKLINLSNDQISKLFDISMDEINILKLKKEVYITILSPVIVWYDYFISNYYQIYPLQNYKLILILILKLFIDNLKGLKILHENNISHIDVNILNSNIIFKENENSLIDKFLIENNLPLFNMVLIDFNSSKLESQSLFSSLSNRYVPKTTHYPPDYKLYYNSQTPTIAYSKAHDIYSLSIVITQYIHILLNCYGENRYEMRFNINNYINKSHIRISKDDRYNIHSVLDDVMKNNVKSQIENDQFLELFEIIKEMNENPWKIINENGYYLQQLEQLQNKILAVHIPDNKTKSTSSTDNSPESDAPNE